MNFHDDGPSDLDQLSAHIDRAWDLVAEGDLEAALRSAYKSLEIDDSSPEAHNLVGYLLAAEGRLEDALHHYQSAIELDEGFLEAILNAAELLLELGQHAEAYELTEDALDLSGSDDDVADALLLRVDVLLAAGRRDEAAEVVQSLPSGPFEAEHLDFHVGRARFEIGDLEGAAALIESTAMERGARAHPDVFYYLGLIHEAKQDVKSATLAFLQCRDLDLATPRPTWWEPIERFERRVQKALKELPPPLATVAEGALVLIDEVPGAEVVSEGLDPRMPVLADDITLRSPRADAKTEGETLRRIFVYQRNIERMVPSLERIDDAIRLALAEELKHSFGPSLDLEELEAAVHGAAEMLGFVPGQGTDQSIDETPEQETEDESDGS